jgi:DNA-binding CsgD family transcriptional regulator
MYLGILSATRGSSDELRSEDLQDDVGLTQQEKTAWRMRVDGYLPSEIAATLGVTRPTAVRALRSAARKVAGRTSKLSGLREIYRLEVRRTTYRKPRHCPEEACKRLGYCKYPGRFE